MAAVAILSVVKTLGGVSPLCFNPKRNRLLGFADFIDGGVVVLGTRRDVSLFNNICVRSL